MVEVESSDLLGGSGSMNGGHEAFNNAKLVMNDFGERGKAVLWC